MFSTLKEHVRQNRHVITVIGKKYQRKKPLEEVDEDARTLLNLFSEKRGMTERTVFIYFRIRTNRSPWLIWQQNFGFHKKWRVYCLSYQIELLNRSKNYFLADISMKISYEILFLKSGYSGRKNGRFKLSVLPVDYYYYFLWLCSPERDMAYSFTMFRDHTLRRATIGRSPLDE
jgi:hypothetical protein